MNARLLRALGLAVLLAPLLAACGPASDGRFDARPGTPSPTCLPHQGERPGTAYTAGQQADPRAVLEMMRFYTAHGTEPYCDGAPPTDVDRRWTELYVHLGGDRRYLS
ncbi:hypothetical protein ACIRBX_00790 [Kitasatospora sp. NPDC096147]|uniref:hypothetical protein n=1 Tax=Kitasatospora sp. NPDC096147 TaxID=3364093 RepID=UPI0037F39EDD